MSGKKLGVTVVMLGVVGTILLGTGCGDTSTGNRSAINNNQGSVSDILQSNTEKSSSEGEDVGGQEPGTDEKVASQGAVSRDGIQDSSVDSNNIDVDLSKLSGTMVYSEVYNIMNEPQNYIGKTIKMTGYASAFHDEVDGKDYYACIIPDATACCTQGIEYDLGENADYPEPDSTITVVGTFGSYQIQDTTYYTLKGASLTE